MRSEVSNQDLFDCGILTFSYLFSGDSGIRKDQKTTTTFPPKNKTQKENFITY